MPSRNLEGTGYTFDRDPDYCPLCHHGIQPNFIAGNRIQHQHKPTVLELLFRCPREACQRVFIAAYWQEPTRDFTSPKGPYVFRRVTPWRQKEVDVPAEVAKISPSYKVLMTQSSAAEHYELDQIAGVGYRKALEFLIKDAAIHWNSEDERKIKELFLSKVIEEYIPDANVKQCAKLATWLGNDETHYVRRWEEKDIGDLKALINLTQAWILNALLTEKYVKDMSPGTAQPAK